MKRFFTVILTLTVLVIFAWYLYFGVGIYLPDQERENADSWFKSRGQEIVHLTEEGQYEPFKIKGVEISASMPGSYATEFAAEKEDYYRWMKQIGEMGANTLKVSYLMEDEFYEALYDYNTEHGEPLYLLQGISVSDEANYGSENARDDKFLGKLKEDGRKAVDILHGKKTVLLGDLGGNGRYRKDVTPWVIGILVGNEWSSDTVIYTDHSLEEKNNYDGVYFKTSENATPFEAALAEIMDETLEYETEKYGNQTLLGFVNSPQNDFLEYDVNYAVQLRKYSSVNAEHVVPGEKNRVGSFAAYQLYDFCDDFSEKLSDEQKAEFDSLLKQLDRESSYDGYMDFLGKYHTMPVICSGYGVSSARGTIKMGEPPVTEEEQGEKILEIYRDSECFNWSGVCISSWQDVWEQKSWNTAFAVDMTRRNRWHDLQTEAQSYGLMAYEPGKNKETVGAIDGKTEEWTKRDEVASLSDGTTLSAKYDWEGLSLLLRGEKISPDEENYVALDLSDEVGSTECKNPNLAFDRNAEFVLCIDGTDNTRILVQDRYHAMRENFHFEITGQNAHTSYPDKDSTEFVTVQMVQRNSTLLENYIDIKDMQARRAATAPGTWDTGLLVHGNGDPEATDFHSLADFCFGEKCVEVRIPWELLNVADPTLMTVHRDYYEHYGVELEKISKIWMGISEKGNVHFEPFRVKGTGNKTEYHERLKQSYYVIQREWKGA